MEVLRGLVVGEGFGGQEEYIITDKKEGHARRYMGMK